jgi:hypothetical protein
MSSSTLRRIKIIMTQLTITQAKPNPAGKDRLGNLVPSSQLAGEWVDFKNTGDESYHLNNIELQHVAYTPSYPNGVWDKVMGFSGNLGVGQVVRVHSGGEIPLESLAPEDFIGANHHLFTGKNYVWNNNRSDTARLVMKQNGQIYEIDKASYSANPPEGRILVRNGIRLI